MDEQNNLQPNTISNIKPIHTYTSDMADAVREQEGTVIKIALAEQKKRERNAMKAESRGSNPKNMLLIIGGIILIVAGVMGTLFLIQKSKSQSVVAPVQTKIEAFINYEDQSYIDTTGMAIREEAIKAITAESQKQTQPNSIKNFFLTTKTSTGTNTLTTSDFLTLLNINMPGGLERSLSPQFMIGSYKGTSGTDTPHLFLMFQTTDYNIAFAGILEWEKTMLDDMFMIFNIDVNGDNQKLFATPFKDIIIENKDARVLSDQSGKDLLYYMFADKNTFVISDNQDTIKEILTRLIAKNIKPL